MQRAAIRDVMKLPRPTMRETLMLGALYAVQAIVSVVLLKGVYLHFHWQAVVWAIIAAILALQPGLSQSVVTSFVRIVATLVGAGVALGISKVHHMSPEIQLIVSLVVIVFICELMRLDTALRTACVAAVIVLTLSEGHVLSTAEQRCMATILGCLMALLVQVVTDISWAGAKKLRRWNAERKMLAGNSAVNTAHVMTSGMASGVSAVNVTPD